MTAPHPTAPMTPKARTWTRWAYLSGNGDLRVCDASMTKYLVKRLAQPWETAVRVQITVIPGENA